MTTESTAGSVDGSDLLSGASWSCTATVPGSRSGPDDLDLTALAWMAASVPGTVADALRSVGATEPPPERLDGQDWWFRCIVPGPSATGSDEREGWLLEVDGLATLADVWLNGTHLVRSESMFATWAVPVDRLEDENELCVRFAALSPVLEQRRPRPRWKVRGVTSQNLRWIRTSLLGRQAGWASIPVPVGPWRPIRLRRRAAVHLVRSKVLSSCAPGRDGRTTGTVAVDLTVAVPARLDGSHPPDARLEVAGRSAALSGSIEGEGWRFAGTVDIAGVERWWPHTHGAQPLYGVRVDVGGTTLDLGEVGFRTIDVDRSDGGFQLVVNGVAVFCRGAGWYPIDPVSLQADPSELAAAVELARSAGMNMLRIPGGTVYEVDEFFSVCDRTGVLVWQDIMLAQLDPPEDEGFVAAMVDEVSEFIDRTVRHPSLAVLCGGEQIEEQVAGSGLPRERWGTPLIESILPEVVGREAPGLAFATSSPTGGDLPFQTDTGVSHYVGVGVHLFPLDDLRRAAPRFVSEGLAFSYPPERSTVDEEFGGDISAHHESDWKRGVHRDAGSWFDLEDVRDHYTTSFFQKDMDNLWRTDHQRALDLGRAAMALVVDAAASEWRRAGSPCAGMLAIALRDLRSGPGWGLVDSSGRPKSGWYGFARACAPVAVLATDEGVNGLALHLVNDTELDIGGRLEIGLHTAVHRVETASCPVELPARGGYSVRAEALFEGFRDLTYAYCFGPRVYELVTADLVDADGQVLSRAAYLPGGPARETDPDVGLQAEIEPADDGMWSLRVSSRRFAQFVQVDVPGYTPDDSWFHLPPGGSREVLLRPLPAIGNGSEPRGRVRALNSSTVGVVSG